MSHERLTICSFQGHTGADPKCIRLNGVAASSVRTTQKLHQIVPYMEDDNDDTVQI